MALFWFSLIAYPLRYATENFLKIWGTFIIEINRLTGLWHIYLEDDQLGRKLEDIKPVNIALIVLSGIVICAYFIFIFSFVICSIWSIW